MIIEFVKMHGLGNDYIVIDALKQDLAKVNLKDLAQRICHRNLGVGADGTILVLRGKTHPFRMRIYNSDGSQAEMCGNGIRCLARYIYENRLSKKTKQNIETLSGPIGTEILKSKKSFLVKVNMGRPILLKEKIPVKGNEAFCVNQNLKIGGKVLKFTAISIGNPHAVIFVDRFDESWQRWGKLIENHPIFPKKINVEFVKVLSRKRIQLKVWERGAGSTLACGTGACAAAVAGIMNGRLDRKLKVSFQYGQLDMEWNEKNNSISMIGPAEKICDGIYDY